jgi:hypothetical protein
VTQYDRDFYAWTQEQARLLKQRQVDALDWENLSEEIESLGKREKRELDSRFRVLLMHLLKWHYQPDRRSRSWFFTVQAQRQAIAQHLEDNPSLKSYQAESLSRAYTFARMDAANETGLVLEDFPVDCLYPLSDVLDPQFFPGIPDDRGLL